MSNIIKNTDKEIRYTTVSKPTKAQNAILFVNSVNSILLALSKRKYCKTNSIYHIKDGAKQNNNISYQSNFNKSG
jgi:hypothetical protein